MKQKSKVTYSTFNAADYLDNEKVIAAYLSEAAEDENPDVLLKALGDVAKARVILREAIAASGSGAGLSRSAAGL